MRKPPSNVTIHLIEGYGDKLTLCNHSRVAKRCYQVSWRHAEHALETKKNVFRYCELYAKSYARQGFKADFVPCTSCMAYLDMLTLADLDI